MPELDKSSHAVPLWAVWFRPPCFVLMGCDKDASRRKTSLFASYLNRDHIIRVEVKQNLDTLYWEASGVIEIIEGGTSQTFSVSGTINTFKTETEAKGAFLQQAKRLIYDRIGS